MAREGDLWSAACVLPTNVHVRLFILFFRYTNQCVLAMALSSFSPFSKLLSEKAPFFAELNFCSSIFFIKLVCPLSFSFLAFALALGVAFARNAVRQHEVNTRLTGEGATPHTHTHTHASSFFKLQHTHIFLSKK